MTRRLLSTHSMLFVEQWLKITADLGRAPATILAYRRALAHYLRHCEAQALRPESARFEDFSAYLRPQLPGMTHPVASATLQLRISAIRLWYDFLFYQETVIVTRCHVPCSPLRVSVLADWCRASSNCPAFRMIRAGLPCSDRRHMLRCATV